MFWLVVGVTTRELIEQQLQLKNMSSSDATWRYELEVPADGRLEVPVPLPAGAHVTVLIVEHPVDESDDLTGAATSSTDFWDNPYDDEDWNNA
jgi:hypothetical protein